MAEGSSGAAVVNPAGSPDERLKPQSGWRRLLSRPELGAAAGAALVFVFFAFTAHGTGMFAADGVLNWTTVSAQLMIIAVGAALLMVAGEFDLSVGSMIGFAGMTIALPTVTFHVPDWVTAPMTAVLAPMMIRPDASTCRPAVWPLVSVGSAAL